MKKILCAAIHFDDVTLKELEDYINMYAWNYGRFFHVGDAEKIKEKVSERMELPEEFLKKYFYQMKKEKPISLIRLIIRKAEFKKLVHGRL